MYSALLRFDKRRRRHICEGVAYCVGSAKDTTSHINAYGILCINIKSGIIVQRAEKCADCGLLIAETRERTKMYVTVVEV